MTAHTASASPTTSPSLITKLQSNFSIAIVLTSDTNKYLAFSRFTASQQHHFQYISTPHHSDDIVAASTFTCFGGLPSELQMLIWEFAATPRPDPCISGCPVFESSSGSTYVHCGISSQLLDCTRHRRLLGTPRQVWVFKSLSTARRRLVLTCRLAHQVTLEMSGVEVQRSSTEVLWVFCLGRAS